MEIKLTYKEAKNNHPDLVNILVDKIHSSNSKDKYKSEQDFEWSYSYGMTIGKLNIGEVFNLNEQDKNTNKIINSKLNSVMGLSLTISAGRTKRYVVLSDKPKLFIDKFSAIYLKDIAESQKEEERFSKLTPDERNRETQEQINQLSEMGGVVAINGDNGIQQVLPQQIDYNIDDILDKIGRVGLEGLTDGEKKFLEQNSKS